MSSDALSQILNALKLKGAIYFHTHFNPPWGIKVPAFKNVARFHMAMRGNCWLRVEGVIEPIHLTTGDLIVIPHGASHILSDTKNRTAKNLDMVISESGYDGQGAFAYGGPEEDCACKLFCGHFEFEEGVMHPILNDLPHYIHIPNTHSMNTFWLESIMRFVSSEIISNEAGSDAIVHRLSEIIFIQVIRAFVERTGNMAGSLAAVLDPKFSRCLTKIHSSPEKTWTVETMAQEAGMSRTVFAEKFNTLVGMTPHGYLTHWRMHQARRELLETDQAMIDIAELVGYKSEAAFNRAFKRQFDITPGQIRKTGVIGNTSVVT